MSACPLPAPSQEDPRVRRLELLISNLLRCGVIASLLFVVGGTALSFAQHSSFFSPATLQTLIQPGATFPRTMPAVLESLCRLEGQAFVLVGLLILIATPVLRVAISIFAFAHQEDRVFVFITALVLGLLMLSFMMGAVE